jgi:hypothetical protein
MKQPKTKGDLAIRLEVRRRAPHVLELGHERAKRG